MNSRVVMDLIRLRIIEAHRVKAMQRERPPCEPRILAERVVLRDIDQRLDRETGRAPR
jgi:hypothetical protein